MSKPQLIIFDCDGVLVDSEKISSQVIAEEISKLGIPMETMEAQNLFTGGSLADVGKYIEAKLGEPIPYDFEAVYRKRSFELFEEFLEPISGIEEVLKAISEKPLKRCVASNGPLQKMLFNLKLTKLLPYFEGHLFSAYEVNRWKPDPFLFLHAAKEMKVLPEHCLVIEDSTHGVEAAVAAGIPVLGFAPDHDGADLKAAGARVFSDMNELPNLIFN
ncbi:MAG: HAD superfamily hydrolase (TIGR01509 family) [Polaribacter sp.]|jgi:HAD superfamily hydrolase (TIGR01509 family)